jgi:hypothetical protein
VQGGRAYVSILPEGAIIEVDIEAGAGKAGAVHALTSGTSCGVG